MPLTGTKRAATDMYEPVESEKVAILDAGAQFGKVIDRRVRELRVEAPWEAQMKVPPRTGMSQHYSCVAKALLHGTRQSAPSSACARLEGWHTGTWSGNGPDR